MKWLKNIGNKSAGGSVSDLATKVVNDPNDQQSISLFCEEAKTFQPDYFDPIIKKAITICLENPGLKSQFLVVPWYTLLSKDPDTAHIFSLAALEDYDDFKKALIQILPNQNIADPCLLAGLKHFLLTNLILERFLNFLRRAILENVIGDHDNDKALAIAGAMAHYCFNTGYIFNVSDDEQKIIEQKIKTLSESSTAYDIALVGCFSPLSSLNDADQILNDYKDHEVLAPMIKELLEQPLNEKQISKTITKLTEIDDNTSKDNQKQYTSFPYPRWRHFDKQRKLSNYFDQLKDKDIDILIAGCGTGQEVMYYSTLFPKARILAIDLSKVSLSYAIRKTKEYGVENVEFKHADILALADSLETKFDIICSSGVLHHMKDPEKGFSVLDGLLKEDGMMRICLYSKIGRRHIISAHEVINDHGFGNSAEEIRRFRNECETLLSAETLQGVLKARDFFIMQQCRDLLFHVMEHQFDIERLQNMLNDNGYKFLEFRLPEDVLDQYHKAFPDDKNASSLKNWAQFEEDNPDTFQAMYKFVCQKSAERS